MTAPHVIDVTTPDIDMPLSEPSRIPSGAEEHHLAFVVAPEPGMIVLARFPDIGGKAAVVVRPWAQPDQDPPVVDLKLLTLVSTHCDDPQLLASLRDWADLRDANTESACHMITLQGAVVVWAVGRAAVVATAERIETVKKALLEFAFYEYEVKDVERRLNAMWPGLEEDSPIAFEFQARSIHKRRELGRRFREVVSLRARVARVTPHVLYPHVHPPTLATQVGERLRERARLSARVEFLNSQLEVFDRVYESCSQRLNDFVTARTGHTLEWVIIILLFVQICLVCAEMFARN